MLVGGGDGVVVAVGGDVDPELENLRHRWSKALASEMEPMPFHPMDLECQ